MEDNADLIRVRSTHAADFTDADPLLGAMSATLPKGDALLDPVKMSKAANFPLAKKMTLALTPNRIIVYKNGWGDKVGNALGDVPLSRVDHIEITWNRKLAVVAIGLSDGQMVVMQVNDPESAEDLRHAFLKLRGRI